MVNWIALTSIFGLFVAGCSHAPVKYREGLQMHPTFVTFEGNRYTVPQHAKQFAQLAVTELCLRNWSAPVFHEIVEDYSTEHPKVTIYFGCYKHIYQDGIVEFAAHTPEAPERYGKETFDGGLIVKKVNPSSVFKVGDVIVALDKTPVVALLVWRTFLSALSPRASVPVKIIRDGSLRTVNLPLSDSRATQFVNDDLPRVAEICESHKYDPSLALCNQTEQEWLSMFRDAGVPPAKAQKIFNTLKLMPPPRTPTT